MKKDEKQKESMSTNSDNFTTGAQDNDFLIRFVREMTLEPDYDKLLAYFKNV